MATKYSEFKVRNKLWVKKKKHWFILRSDLNLFTDLLSLEISQFSAYIQLHIQRLYFSKPEPSPLPLWTSFSSDSRWKINTTALLIFQSTKLTNQKGCDGHVHFGFVVMGRKSMLHSSISRVQGAEREKEEEVCCWGCGYTVSVPSIDFHRKSNRKTKV